MNLREIDREFVWHPYTAASASSQLRIPVIVRGSGVHLFDEAGEKYVDAGSSWWVCNLGHGHPELVSAIKEQADILQHSILGTLSHPSIIKLSEQLCSLFTDSARHVFYASDGACAVEAAIKIAIQYWENLGRPQKNRIASLEGGYHGDTLGCVSAAFDRSVHGRYGAIITPGIQVPFNACRTCTIGADGRSTPCCCFEPMAKALEEHADALAAVIVEPMCQGSGGMRIYSANYLKRLAEYCEKHDVLLIADEIAMGFGKTGKMFGHQHAGIDPDIVCVGKGLTNGYLPMSAAIVKNRIYETFTDDKWFDHGHTFAGNPICAALALKVLEIYRRDRVIDRVAPLSKILADRLQLLVGQPRIVDVRVLGMIAAVELDNAGYAVAGKAVDLVDCVLEEMYARKIMIRSLGRVVYLVLPLVSSVETITETAGTFVETIQRMVAEANEGAVVVA